MVRLALAAWIKVKEYVGIYNIPGLDYAKLRHMYIAGFRTIWVYILETFKILCEPPQSFYDKTVHIMSSTIIQRHVFKMLAAGYKSKEFYIRMLNMQIPKCVCGCNIENIYLEECHFKTKKHINAINSGKFDQHIIEKYKEDPARFMTIGYSGYRYRLSSKKRRLVNKFGDRVLFLN